MKPTEVITRSFKLYPTTDQAARYVCAGITELIWVTVYYICLGTFIDYKTWLQPSWRTLILAKLIEQSVSLRLQQRFLRMDLRFAHTSISGSWFISVNNLPTSSHDFHCSDSISTSKADQYKWFLWIHRGGVEQVMDIFSRFLHWEKLQVPCHDLWGCKNKRQVYDNFGVILVASRKKCSGFFDFNCHIQYICISWMLMFGLFLAIFPTGTPALHTHSPKHELPSILISSCLAAILLLWLLHEKGLFDPIYDWWEDHVWASEQMNRYRDADLYVRKHDHRHEKRHHHHHKHGGHRPSDHLHHVHKHGRLKNKGLRAIRVDEDDIDRHRHHGTRRHRPRHHYWTPKFQGIKICLFWEYRFGNLDK